MSTSATAPPDSGPETGRDTRPPSGAIGRLVSRWVAPLVLLAALLLSGGVMAWGAGGDGEGSPNSVPPSSEAARVTDLQKQFPDAGVAPVLAVVTRADGGQLTPADLGAAAQARPRMLEVDRGQVGGAPAGPPILPAPDGRAALVLVPVDAELNGLRLTDTVTEIRAAAAKDLPEALRIQVTGGPAFGADIASAFKGADFRLLGATAAVVGVLLLLTYRSPILWLVPLTVVAVADRVAAIVASRAGELAGFTLDGSTTGITSVLVFGAGTNYALLLVSRYREELRREPDHRRALAIALKAAGPAILASNITVVLALATLLAAVAPNTRVLGFSAAIGLIVALLFALVVLPAALAVCGRGLFWPFVPRVGDRDRSESGAWHRVAAAVVRRPLAVLLATLPVLALLCFGLAGTRVGLDQTEQFRVRAESVDGFDTLRAHFPPGLSNPTTLIARTDGAAAVEDAAKRTPGVVEVRRTGASDTGLTRWQVVLDAEPASPEAFRAVESLRGEVRSVTGAEAVVGGPDAAQLDSRQTAERDQRVVIPLILGVVLLVLIVLLRAALAPVLLIVATIASAFAALGAGAWISTRLLGFPALDTSVPLFAILFLVALGVDYTIFLVTRAREETPEHGTRDGMVRSVAVTGGVITSAGIVLAAVFAVLGVLPLITLTQLGIVVGIGILLDTFVVRTLVIPALVSLVGRRVWWPSALARSPE
ncbi:MMPL family transporter [Mariniluteicoccus flavus]